jgi:large conductance mechanosensitive channel
MFKEFKKFILRGNVLDLAVAVIIGVAFGAVVNSLVNDIIMPPIGLLLGKVNFTDLFINLSGTAYTSLKLAKDAGAPTLNYGLFINTLLNFIIIAFVIFLVVKAINKLQGPKEKPPVTTKECPYCLSTIPAKATKCANCTSDLKK